MVVVKTVELMPLLVNDYKGSLYSKKVQNLEKVTAFCEEKE
ncbi:hypothetical protein HMPREF0621_0215 [Pasteurella dagmatis ATCC 43325]|uniref:Uncharacterized protein n=1 Tax=Pasteurella dagmatis ATCC 43325 TaxID=667128 RepID=C9PMJ1_9PAST|nr:hypothetical protein HMPREF0621_0215 [Pasteurella dagmatis ATCC 43325]